MLLEVLMTTGLIRPIAPDRSGHRAIGQCVGITGLRGETGERLMGSVANEHRMPPTLLTGRRFIFIPPRIAQIHRVPARIGIAVRPHARLADVEPVGLQEHRERGVVVTGVEILETGPVIEPLADVALRFARHGRVSGVVELLPIGSIDRLPCP